LQRPQMIRWAFNNHHWMDATIVGPVFALQYRMSGCLYAGDSKRGYRSSDYMMVEVEIWLASVQEELCQWMVERTFGLFYDGDHFMRLNNHP
jgi:hypothetical protein